MTEKFEQINRGFNEVFQPGRLSIGLVIPIEEYSQSSVPSMKNHLARIKLAEALGFKAIWLRDVPMHLPSFGDAGQTYDPFSYLGFIAGQTEKIALGVASIALPLHHPVHVAKSAASIDQLSEGRLILGVASGDRFEEYPAMNVSHEKRGELFREAFTFIRQAASHFPLIEKNHFGHLDGKMDILPKPFAQKIPMLITGHSQQSVEWISRHGDGWMYYPRNLYAQQLKIKEWRAMISDTQAISKPFLQPLYLDLHKDDNFKPTAIHLGIRTGLNPLLEYLYLLQDIGVNHLAINLRFNKEPIEETLKILAEKILAPFHNL